MTWNNKNHLIVFARLLQLSLFRQFYLLILAFLRAFARKQHSEFSRTLTFPVGKITFSHANIAFHLNGIMQKIGSVFSKLHEEWVAISFLMQNRENGHDR